MLQPRTSNGIKKTSLVRLSKIATVDRKLILGIIGSLDQTELAELNTKLKLIFQLP